MKTPRLKPELGNAPNRRDGFTIIELLAVLAVLALLLTIQLPALTNASSQTKRAQCASNLRQFTLAIHLLASENGGALPSSSAGAWAWDLPWAIGPSVESTGSKWTVMFCPGTAPRFTEADNFQLYNFAPPNIRVLGYAHTFPGSATINSTNWNHTLIPQPVQIALGTFARPLASERVLLADVVMSASGQSNPSPAARSTYNYTAIQGGFPKAHLTSHLAGKMPLGGNLGMLDGHVEWRQFADMNPRTDGFSPVFWW